MLPIKVPDWDEWDEQTETFVSHKGPHLKLEHSLISISKWEGITHKPYFNSDKTDSEMLMYIACMVINAEPTLEELSHLGVAELNKIGAYINDKHTATWFREDENKKPPSTKVITSELIYYWMIKAGVPFACEKWHIERLLTLIRVINEKEKPPKKIPRRTALAQQAKLNAQRKARLGTTG